MHIYIISIFDSIFIRKNGRYIKNVLSDYSDIGKEIDGSIVSEQQYLKIESNYISCIIDIFNHIGADELVIDGYEEIETDRWKNGQHITGDLLPHILRDLIRTKCWCRLSSENAFIHYGEDFIMYVGCNINYDDMDFIVKKHNLFFKQVNESPYTPEEDEIND